MKGAQDTLHITPSPIHLRWTLHNDWLVLDWLWQNLHASTSLQSSFASHDNQNHCHPVSREQAFAHPAVVSSGQMMGMEGGSMLALLHVSGCLVLAVAAVWLCCDQCGKCGAGVVFDKGMGKKVGLSSRSLQENDEGEVSHRYVRYVPKAACRCKWGHQNLSRSYNEQKGTFLSFRWQVWYPVHCSHSHPYCNIHTSHQCYVRKGREVLETITLCSIKFPINPLLHRWSLELFSPNGS